MGRRRRGEFPNYPGSGSHVLPVGSTYGWGQYTGYSYSMPPPIAIVTGMGTHDGPYARVIFGGSGVRGG
jgi:hypothetical protein